MYELVLAPMSARSALIARPIESANAEIGAVDHLVQRVDALGAHQACGNPRLGDRWEDHVADAEERVVVEAIRVEVELGGHRD